MVVSQQEDKPEMRICHAAESMQRSERVKTSRSPSRVVRIGLNSDMGQIYRRCNPHDSPAFAAGAVSDFDCSVGLLLSVFPVVCDAAGCALVVGGDEPGVTPVPSPSIPANALREELVKCFDAQFLSQSTHLKAFTLAFGSSSFFSALTEADLECRLEPGLESSPLLISPP